MHSCYMIWLSKLPYFAFFFFTGLLFKPHTISGNGIPVSSEKFLLNVYNLITLPPPSDVCFWHARLVVLHCCHCIHFHGMIKYQYCTNWSYLCLSSYGIFHRYSATATGSLPSFSTTLLTNLLHLGLAHQSASNMYGPLQRSCANSSWQPIRKHRL
jgi:hypothetical protein